MEFEYTDQIKGLLLSMSLDERFPSKDLGVGYGGKYTYNKNIPAFVSLNLECAITRSKTNGSGSFWVNGINFVFTGSTPSPFPNTFDTNTQLGTIYINTQSFAGNSRQYFISGAINAFTSGTVASSGNIIQPAYSWGSNNYTSSLWQLRPVINVDPTSSYFYNNEIPLSGSTFTGYTGSATLVIADWSYAVSYAVSCSAVSGAVNPNTVVPFTPPKFNTGSVVLPGVGNPNTTSSINMVATYDNTELSFEGYSPLHYPGYEYYGNASGSLDSLQIFMPSSSVVDYLTPKTETSTSLASLIEEYTNISLTGDRTISTQIIITPGTIAPLACNNVNCYTADNGYWIYGPLPSPLTVNTTTGAPFTPPSTQNLGNRQLRRPIVGGVSITSTSKLGSVGTMGLVCQDSASGALVGLTNNHVIIRDPFYTDQRTYVNPQNEYDLLDANSTPDRVYQDAENTALLFPGSNREVGRVLRYAPLYTSASTIANPAFINKVDGAIFSLYCTASDGIDILSFSTASSYGTGSYQQYGLAYTSSMPFATTAEINNLLNTNPIVYSSGRTSGAKGYDPCPLRILGFTNSTISYPLQGVNTPAYMQDLIAFVKPQDSSSFNPILPGAGAAGNLCPFPAWYGDSGSTLIAKIGGIWKIIGLVFAGNSYTFTPSVVINGSLQTLFYASDIGYACRIDHVANELGIKAWTGSIAPVVDNDSITYVTVSGSNDDRVLNCSGSSYWQVGLTTRHDIC